jgi:HEAT repeat protein
MAIGQEVTDVKVEVDLDKRISLALDLASFVKQHPSCGRSTSVVDDIAGLLNDDADGVRFAAAMALEDIGPSAKRAVPALIRAMNRSDAILDAQHLTALPTSYSETAIRAALRKITGKRIPEYNDVVRPAPPMKLR